jgi:toxin ParE1/3/4
VILSVTQRPQARVDLLEFVYFLVKQPRIGGPYDYGLPELAGLRRLPVKGFNDYLVFHLPHSGGIDVIRVIHGARDIDNLFQAE